VIRLITLLILSSMTVMAGATIAPALPKIRVFFQMAPDVDFWVKLLLTIPALFTAISAPFAGALIDRFGRKPLLICAVILYGLAGGSGFFLDDLSSLLAGRALLGLSVGGIMTTATALVADYYQGQKRNQVMGIQAAFMGYGGVAFLLLGGFLADLNWRYPFLIYLIAFAIAPLTLFSLVEPRSKSAQPKEAAKTPERLPIVTVAAIYGLTFLSMVAFYMIPVQIPFYLQSTGTLSGIAIASCTLASALMSMRYRSIKNSLSFQGILVIVYLLMGLGYLGISLSPNYGFVVGSLIVAGAGLGLLMPNMNVWINAIAPVKFRGRALGGVTSAMFLGQFFSPILIQPIANHITLRAAYGAVGGMLWGIAIVVIFAAILNRTRLRANSK
jgi:MFS family permease